MDLVPTVLVLAFVALSWWTGRYIDRQRERRRRGDVTPDAPDKNDAEEEKSAPSISGRILAQADRITDAALRPWRRWFALPVIGVVVALGGILVGVAGFPEEFADYSAEEYIDYFLATTKHRVAPRTRHTLAGAKRRIVSLSSPNEGEEALLRVLVVPHPGTPPDFVLRRYLCTPARATDVICDPARTASATKTYGVLLSIALSKEPRTTFGTRWRVANSPFNDPELAPSDLVDTAGSDGAIMVPNPITVGLRGLWRALVAPENTNH